MKTKFILPMVISGLLLTSCDLSWLGSDNSKPHREEIAYFEDMFPKIYDYSYIDIDFEENYDRMDVVNGYIVNTDQNQIYVYIIDVAGYNPGIRLAVGLYEDGKTIYNLKVLSHSETNAGTYGGPLLNSPEFAAQFINLAVSDIEREVDFVAGSTAKITLNAVKQGTINLVKFHKEKILKQKWVGVDLTEEEIELINLDIKTGEDLTETFMTSLKEKVPNRVYERAQEDLENFYYFSYKERNSLKKKNGIIITTEYNCEVNDGIRQKQKCKLFISFENGEKNVDIILLSSNDSLSSQNKEKIKTWITENYNGKSFEEINNSIIEDEIDFVSGASFTSQAIRETINKVITYYIRANIE